MISIQDLYIGVAIALAVVFAAGALTALVHLFDEVKHLKQQYEHLSEFVDRMNARPGVTHLRSETIERL